MRRLAKYGRVIGVFAVSMLVLFASVLCAVYGCAWGIHYWGLTGGWWLAVFFVCILVPLLGLYILALRHLMLNQWRVSIKWSIVCISLFCLFFALFGHVYRAQLHRQGVIYKFWLAGGRVGVMGSPVRTAPNFLRLAIGFDPFEEIEDVTVNDSNALVVIAENPETFQSVQQILLQCDIDWQRTACLNDIPALKTAIIQTFGPIDVGALSQWRNLEMLRFFGCRRFIGANADQHVMELSELKHLEVLDLWQVDVSDEGLLALSELTNLDRLSVLETKVTVDGVAEFKTALPECEVVSDAR